jgi:hypothetical protein
MSITDTANVRCFCEVHHSSSALETDTVQPHRQRHRLFTREVLKEASPLDCPVPLKAQVLRTASPTMWKVESDSVPRLSQASKVPALWTLLRLLR